MFLSPICSWPEMPKARAISRLPTLPERASMKARSSGLLQGRGVSISCRAVWPMDPPDRTCAETGWSISRLSASHGFAALCRGRRRCGRRAADRSRFARPARLLRARLPRPPHRPLGRGIAGLGVDQGHRVLELHRLRRLVGRQRGVDAVVADIGSVAAVLGDDCTALDRMLAQRSPGVRAEPAAPSALELLFRNQGHGAVEADVEDIVSRLETRIGLAVLNVRTVSAETGEDRFARLRMQADLARKSE